MVWDLSLNTNIQSMITCLIDDNKRDDLTLGDNSIDDFKIGDSLDFTMFMSYICKIICKIMIVFLAEMDEWHIRETYHKYGNQFFGVHNK